MRAPLRTVVAVAALIACLALVELFVRQRLEHTLREQLGHVMDATRDASVEDVETWVGVGLRGMEALSRDANVRRLSSECAQNGLCEPCSTALAPYLAASGLGNARLVDRRGGLLASLRSTNTPLDANVIERIGRMSVGPYVVGAALEQAQPALLYAAPLGGEVILIAEQPLEPLSKQISATRVGRTGETCTFDAQGRMLTKSRFLTREQKEQPTFLLREPGPGGRLTQAVTLALANTSGRQLDGYLDFRGVRVVGAYRFLQEHGIGIVSEVDYDDAYRTLSSVTRAFVVLGGLLAFVLAIALALYARDAGLRKRVAAAEERANRYGQYQIEAKLGEGGMGAVYLANHALLRRKAAIKLLRTDRTSPDALERFEREVQVTSTLTHPNTVAIYDYGRTDDGTFYYVMEHLDGFDLQRLVALTGPLPQARVLALLRQVCGSLAEAHAAGVVHRDIKPANLFLCTRGCVADTIKVLDFGIVHVGTIDRNEEPIVLGTPEYMAPELFESATRASAQSDLYSLGICAYYLLTGAPPFSGGATMDIGRAHLADTPPPLEELLGEKVDHELDAAIQACVRKDPNARPSSANALIALLNRSKLAHEWTAGDATAWWTEHAALLRLARVSSTPESSKRSIMVSTRA
jgi:hypothetical protein